MTRLQTELRRYQPALWLDETLSPRMRRGIRLVLLVMMLVSGTMIALYALELRTAMTVLPPVLSALVPSMLTGLFYLTAGLLFFFYFLFFFYNALYYRGIDAIVFGGFFGQNGITYEVAQILARSDADITKQFLRSPVGAAIVHRCGVTADTIEQFLTKVRSNVSHRAIAIPESGFFTIDDLAHVVYKNDSSFRQLLNEHALTPEEFTGAVHWVVRRAQEEKYRARWWSREQLLTGEGIGSGLAYGVAFALKKFTKPLEQGAVFSAFTKDIAYADAVVSRMETALSRVTEANVLLVGEPGVGKMDILIELDKKMRQGRSATAIAHSRLVVFDGEHFSAAHTTAAEFETQLVRLLEQAATAGRVTLVIDNLPQFLLHAETIGVDAASLLEPFLASPSLHIIATTAPNEYHNWLKPRQQFIQHFDPIYVEHADMAHTIRVVEDVAQTYEEQYRVFFAYPALHALVRAADRYITDGVMPHKAVTLLGDVLAKAQTARVDTIDKPFVLEVISQKTGIAVGAISDQERTTLNDLETLLANRVVGQKNAITAIARALRRSRAGLQAPDKPVASFLFLGSTGVGKTETAKALAEVYYGGADHMQRLDMSEYSGADALERLLGSSDDAGVLSTLASEYPHGIILLDEFEKAAADTHNLFLQIFDEGMCTNARGESVVLRNHIFIATSNAGSELIWDLASAGKSPSAASGEIIDAIIHSGVFTPELVNRFDSVIIFEPLSLEEQERVALLLLLELQGRIKEQGYDLDISQPLISRLVREGYDPKFGARPMRRLLQDEIEARIARKIIAGDVSPGETITFTEEDFVDNTTV